MPQEKYQPTQEEIEKAEESMNTDQEKSSKSREETLEFEEEKKEHLKVVSEIVANVFEKHLKEFEEKSQNELLNGFVETDMLENVAEEAIEKLGSIYVTENEVSDGYDLRLWAKKPELVRGSSGHFNRDLRNMLGASRVGNSEVEKLISSLSYKFYLEIEKYDFYCDGYSVRVRGQDHTKIGDGRVSKTMYHFSKKED